MWPLSGKRLNANDTLLSGHMWPSKMFRPHFQLDVHLTIPIVLFPDVLCGHLRRINRGLLSYLHVF